MSGAKVLKKFDVCLDQIVRIPEAKAPPTLYHYTNWKGFEGIIQSRRIWATDHRHTNDEHEFSAADEIVRRVAETQLRSARDGVRIALDLFLKAFDQVRVAEHVVAYLACFSEAPDEPAMWCEQYTDHGAGLAIGLKTLDESLPPFEDRRLGRSITPVDYDNSSWDKNVAGQFDKIAEAFNLLPHHNLRQEEVAITLMLRAFCLSAAHQGVRAKHARWSVEREWRIVGVTDPRNKPPHLVRLGRGGRDVPYLALPIRAEGRPLVLDEIILGPNQKHLSAREDLINILRTAGYPHSDAPMPRISVSTVGPT